mmetsp:Transcript_30293/g.88593  ORF Transcript_30293/g.88593 Transcript_30293/m.88593 type:complete len:610 (+) Transcript_30293:107-1936(+)|eukprot:CAMPEP_0181020130 /NCGR_PEP_ID=MMETSP1070-20121207/283_1 /TAXON_ID=265543 /ORGANISM="Minutocellus polymorphus, Strain NH13" /LENGTH=609 /DNA_ID=CAMNT_0023096917 /DNA_START=64 /DNA_END=1893 /DNA_ORIENTATION=-
MFRATHPTGVGRKRSNSASSVSSSAAGGGNASVATSPGESSSERPSSASLPQHKLAPSTSTPTQTGEAGTNDTKPQDMNSSSNIHSTSVAESHRQRQHQQYPTQKANREIPPPQLIRTTTTASAKPAASMVAPSTPKSNRDGGMPGASSDNRRRQVYSTPKRGGNGRVVHSPLIDAPPTPNPNAKDARLIKPRDRWKAMSELAGSHKQSLEVLDLSNRSLPVQALKFGVPRKTAESVTDLRYDGNLVGEGNDGNNDLPAFLDIVVQLFPRLQHLSLRNNPCSPGNSMGGASPMREAKLPANVDPKLKSKLDAAIDAATREQRRMQRLYIIYRLPDLLSIDDKSVSDVERQMARPLNPSGTPVNQQQWLTKAMAPVNVDVGVGIGFDADDMKVKIPASDLDQDDAESEMIVPSEAGGMAMSSVEVSMSGLVNYVRTENEDMDPKDEQKLCADDVTSATAGGGKSGKGSTSVEFASDSKKAPPTARQASRELPPPSPFSKQRTFPPPRQSRRTIKTKGGKNTAAKQLWRQRNKRNVNVESMVDDESDEESTDDEVDEDEDDLVVPKSKSESDSDGARLTRSISNDDLESKSTASSSLATWGGTLGTASQMD